MFWASREKKKLSKEIDAFLDECERKKKSEQKLTDKQRENYERLPDSCQAEELPPGLYAGEQREKPLISREKMDEIWKNRKKKQIQRAEALTGERYTPVYLDLSKNRLISVRGTGNGERDCLFLQRLTLQLALNYGASGLRIAAADFDPKKPLAWLKNTFVCQTEDRKSLYFDSKSSNAQVASAIRSMSEQYVVLVCTGDTIYAKNFLVSYPDLRERQRLIILIAGEIDRDSRKRFKITEVYEKNFSFCYEQEDLLWAAARLTISPASDGNWGKE